MQTHIGKTRSFSAVPFDVIYVLLRFFALFIMVDGRISMLEHDIDEIVVCGGSGSGDSGDSTGFLYLSFPLSPSASLFISLYVLVF